MNIRNIITFLFILSLISTPAWSTTWFYYDNEAGTVGSSLPNSAYGPYRFEYDLPGIYRSDSPVGKYAELSATNLQVGYLVEIQNRDAVYGTRWGSTYPLTITQGTTYYIAGKFRFDRINGQSIWQDTSAELADAAGSFDKLFEFQGNNFRWGISSGWDDANTYPLCRSTSPRDQCVGKFTFGVWVDKNPEVSCYEGYDHLVQNVSPYNGSNPYFCYYERWYSIVMGVTAYNSTNGRVQLWINGTKVYDYQNIHTMCSTTGPNVMRIYLNGTIAQPAYDAPAHKRSFDGIMFTDSWQELVNRGYLTGSAPVTSSTTSILADITPPAVPTGLAITE